MAKQFPYEERARAAREAQKAFHEAFKRVTRRNDFEDPATKEWHAALARYRAVNEATFPGGLKRAWRQVRDGEFFVPEVLSFLEADPYSYRSGYLKALILRRLKNIVLDEEVAERLRAVALDVIERRGSPELREYCRLARRIRNDPFIGRLRDLTRSNCPQISRRARTAFCSITDQSQKPYRLLEHPWLDATR